jgi:hypothetical protein
MIQKTSFLEKSLPKESLYRMSADMQDELSVVDLGQDLNNDDQPMNQKTKKPQGALE